jgi:hypothetical protein
MPDVFTKPKRDTDFTGWHGLNLSTINFQPLKNG